MPAEYRAVWSVPGGGTGYSVFHFQNATSTIAQDQADGIRDFLGSLQAGIPDDVTISFESEVLELSNAGVLLAVHPVTAPATFNGTNTGDFSRATGVRVDWNTGVIVSGRRLTGRTYIVPYGSGAFDTNGLLDSSSIAFIKTAADTLISTSNTFGNLAVWSRAHDVTHDVVTSSVPAKGAILRSRRD